MDDKDRVILDLRSQCMGVKAVARHLGVSPAAIRKRIQKMEMRGELTEGNQGGTASGAIPSREGESQRGTGYNRIESGVEGEGKGNHQGGTTASLNSGAKQPSSYDDPFKITDKYPKLFKPFLGNDDLVDEDVFCEQQSFSPERIKLLQSFIDSIPTEDKEALSEQADYFLDELSDWIHTEKLKGYRENPLVTVGLQIWAYGVWDHLTRIRGLN